MKKSLKIWLITWAFILIIWWSRVWLTKAWIIPNWFYVWVLSPNYNISKIICSTPDFIDSNKPLCNPRDFICEEVSSYNYECCNRYGGCYSYIDQPGYDEQYPVNLPRLIN